MHIGRYEILGLLGRGGMGAVYKARLPELGKIVALKLLDPVEHMVDLLGMDAVKRQFVAEARLMARLSHPNLSAVWDLDEDDAGRPFFVLEYACHNLGGVMGESYRVEEPSRKLRPEKAFRYTRQTLQGLARMHYAGVVHRDIKPFNLLLSDQDTVKIIDFGLSKLRGEIDPDRPSGMKIGSPYYAAPEQEDDPEAAGPPADLYGVGVTLYRMLSGRLPHGEVGRCGFGMPEGQEPDAGDEEGLSREAPLDKEVLGEELFSLCEDFFRKSLAPNPADRFNYAHQMLEALEYFEARWREQVEAICGVPENWLEETEPEPEAVAVRSTPIKTGPRMKLESFGIDHLGRPLAARRPIFEPDGDIVRDPAAGLVWQRSGVDFPVNWTEAQEYVEALNASRFAGLAGWRLPTVPELSRLLDQAGEVRDYCMDPVFDREQRYLWSADQRTFTQAWMVNAAMGYVDRADMTCRLWVRAVCEAE
ncbi:MAG: protein kinase domain-containing protein [Oceanidesulfovibrio sp.]